MRINNMKLIIITLIVIFIGEKYYEIKSNIFVPSVTIDRWIPKEFKYPVKECGKLTKADAG